MAATGVPGDFIFIPTMTKEEPGGEFTRQPGSRTSPLHGRPNGGVWRLESEGPSWGGSTGAGRASAGRGRLAVAGPSRERLLSPAGKGKFAGVGLGGRGGSFQLK